MAWIDQHCHLPPGGAGTDLIEDARAAGVTRMITVGTTLQRSVEAIGIAAAHEDVWATAGVHPHHATDGLDGIEELLARDRVVAVGEAGLDYHYDHSPRPVQREVFAAQVDLAHRHDLPLVIHTREAWDDTLEVLDREGVPPRTVFHCFTGGTDEATACLERGALLSFSGIITFPGAPEVREAAASCPLDRLLVETDSPYLTPVPHRGRPNRPALVTLVGAAVADVKGCSTREVADATWSRAAVFYGLDPS